IAITILPYIENKNDIDAISGTVNNIRDSPVRGADIRRTKTAARLLRSAGYRPVFFPHRT
ncbi:MAG: hypothetical protein ABF502_08785, partial [Acetobacter sp.]|uniref:hypothetical protein n=1 Tax=Acetobacter sp. TaxID=440 RepID=UPI0039ECEAB7